MEKIMNDCDLKYIQGTNGVFTRDYNYVVQHKLARLLTKRDYIPGGYPEVESSILKVMCILISNGYYE